MKVKCINPVCPVGFVILEPKDSEEGFNLGEIIERNADDYDCPYCLYPLHELVLEDID